MFNRSTVDLITHSPDMAEFALYLVEPGPWDDESRLKKVQDRIYNVVDFILDGQLASDFPDSRGKRIRVEVVCKGGPPPVQYRQLVERLNEIIHTVADYRNDIESNRIVTSLEITYSEKRQP